LEQNDNAKSDIDIQENMQDDTTIYHLKPDADVTHLSINVNNPVGGVALPIYVDRMLTKYVASVFVFADDDPSNFFAILVLGCLTFLVSLVLLAYFCCRCYSKSTINSKKMGLCEVVPYSPADNDSGVCVSISS